MVGDHVVAGLDVCGVQDVVDLVQWHIELAEPMDDLGRGDLLRCVAPVSGLGVDVDRLQQADSW